MQPSVLVQEWQRESASLFYFKQKRDEKILLESHHHNKPIFNTKIIRITPSQ